MFSNRCLRLRRTQRLTQSYTSFSSASSALTPSTTSRKQSVATTRSSHIPNNGIIHNLRHIHTGLSLKTSHVMSLTLNFRVYYMFANMASLNKWRRARGFSDLIYHTPRILFVLTWTYRHLCLPSALWRSRRHRPSDVRILDFSFYLSWDTIT
jgi:hypothetical protein